MARKITTDCVESYLKCKTKAHLKALGEPGVNSEYGLLLAEMNGQTKRTMIAPTTAPMSPAPSPGEYHPSA